jgi:hypothetical protein
MLDFSHFSPISFERLTQAVCIHLFGAGRGVQLIYHPDAGYAGHDDLRYIIQYPLGRRAVSVFVTMAAAAPGGLSAAPSGLTAPMPEIQQSSGPVPVCEELIF